jgi:two-component system cell cycle sensor histidine kinase/response regulator CckA
VLCAFEAGAVDFIREPFSVEEVLARLRAQLRQARGGHETSRARTLDEVLQTLNALLFAVDTDGVIQAVLPPPAETQLTPALEQLSSGRRVDEALPKHAARVLMDLVSQAREGRTAVSGSCQMTEHGGWAEFFISAARHGDDGSISVGLARDISEQRQVAEEKARLDEALRQSEKMESIGRFAVGISHDMNNILGVVMSLASALRVDLQPESDLQEDADHIVGACRRGYELTSKLSCLASRVDCLKEPLSLNATVEESLEVLERSVPPSVQIETRLAEDLPQINGDPVLLSHVVVNLAINAFDAMPDHGTLTLATRVERLGPAALATSPELQPGMYVFLEVTDTGIGMSSGIRARAFEPFFTTKSKDKGFGLGLPMVYGIVKNHGGRVTLRSETRQGTTVTIALPTSPPPVEETFEALAAPDPRPEAGTILVVDDEDLMLYSLRKLLQRLGYTVLTADTGATALELFRRRHDEIAMVLLDLIMPGMDGESIFRRMKEVDPGVRVLLCTGHSDDRLISSLRSAGVLGVVRKPFVVQQLEKQLKEVIGDRRGG